MRRGLSQLLPDQASERPDQALDRSEPASERLGPASERPGPASERPGPASRRPDPASVRPDPASERLDPASERPDKASEKPEPAYERPEPASVCVCFCETVYVSFSLPLIIALTQSLISTPHVCACVSVHVKKGPLIFPSPFYSYQRSRTSIFKDFKERINGWMDRQMEKQMDRRTD